MWLNRPNTVLLFWRTAVLRHGHRSRRSHLLTYEFRNVIRLIVVFDGHEHRVEKHQHDDEPIEPLRFYHAPDPEPKTFLGPPHGRANAFLPHPVFECGRARETWASTRKQTSPPRCSLISHHVRNAANGTLLPAVYQNELIVKHRQVARPYDERFVIYTVSFVTTIIVIILYRIL